MTRSLGLQWNSKASLSKIVASLFGRQTVCQLWLLVTNNAYLVGFKGRRRLIAKCGKFAAVSCGIRQSGIQNLEKFVTENCGP